MYYGNVYASRGGGGEFVVTKCGFVVAAEVVVGVETWRLGPSAKGFPSKR